MYFKLINKSRQKCAIQNTCQTDPTVVTLKLLQATNSTVILNAHVATVHGLNYHPFLSFSICES